MAISMLQDAQQRNLAAALAGIKRDDVECTLAMSPPMSANTSGSSAVAAAMYPGLQQAAAASAFSMFSPTQLMAANRQAAAAFMAAQLPMSQLASTLFPHHPAALFGSWAAGAAGAPHLPHLPLSSSPHSPPASPHSPIGTCVPATAAANTHTVVDLNTPLSGKHSLGTISPTACSQGELPPKKSRKSLALKKEVTSPPTNEISMSVGDLYHHHHQHHPHHHTLAGPMSPPSSGSSPNSTHDSSSSVNNVAAKDASRDKSFTCKICSRSFGYKHVLQNHERTHTGEKPFECPECHKRFTRDHHLKTHMRLHTGEKPYHCSHCDRQFVQVANLRRHLRVHTGERPYTCEICDGKFSDSNQLKSHMLVHNGEKPFECERCHVKFRRRHHLINHKCGTQSPPTPALSPAMSGDYGLCDQKSAMGSSYCSEESIDLGGVSTSSVAATTTNAINMSMENVANASVYEEEVAAHSHHEGDDDEVNADHENDNRNNDDGGDVDDGAPLDLSEEGAGAGSNGTENGRCRKPHDIRRVFRLPPRIVHVQSDLPVQTEPEDLSMHTPRAYESKMASPMTMSMTMRSRSRSETTIMDDRSHQVNEEMMMMMHHDDIDLDELDDAATLYLRQQQLKQKQQQQLASMTRGMRVE